MSFASIADRGARDCFGLTGPPECLWRAPSTARSLPSGGASRRPVGAVPLSHFAALHGGAAAARLPRPFKARGGGPTRSVVEGEGALNLKRSPCGRAAASLVAPDESPTRGKA